jgi:hypothetical protein
MIARKSEEQTRREEWFECIAHAVLGFFTAVGVVATVVLALNACVYLGG